ncbi:helix-turn-helix domain-containing protein [Streptococcus equi]
MRGGGKILSKATLKELRLAQKKTQKELSALTGISVRTLAR